MANILIIDDSAVIRELLSEYLRHLGWEVELADNGLDGIEMALASDYDVVFCDIHLPKRNGYQVLMEVTQHKPDLKFIMTDSLPDDLAEKAQQAGAYCCLAKPFDLGQVNDTLAEILQGTSTPCLKKPTKTST
ncbi:MAG: response regulator [bacterium]